MGPRDDYHGSHADFLRGPFPHSIRKPYSKPLKPKPYQPPVSSEFGVGALGFCKDLAEMS